MPDENIIFNGYSFADEGVAGYFTVFANKRILLNLNKSADFCIITNATAIKIDKLGEFYIFSEFYII
jgi:hypothetical protein